MNDFTRRRFLQQTSLGAGGAVLGAAALSNFGPLAAPPAPEGPADQNSPSASNVTFEEASPGAALADSVVIHVRDVATAEIALLTGTQEIIYRDPELVERLKQVVRSGSPRVGVSNVVAP